MAIDSYLNLITSEHYDKPKFMAWLTAVLNIGDSGITVANAIPSAFDVNQATGVSLDTLGQQIGRTRFLPFQLSDGTNPVLDDSNFRTSLKAKIAQNQWDGTIPQMYELWNDAFPEANLQIKDNQNMSMTATIRGQLGLQSVELVTVGYIFPKPGAVSLDIRWESDITQSNYMALAVTTRDTYSVDCLALSD